MARSAHCFIEMTDRDPIDALEAFREQTTAGPDADDRVRARVRASLQDGKVPRRGKLGMIVGMSAAALAVTVVVALRSPAVPAPPPPPTVAQKPAQPIAPAQDLPRAKAVAAVDAIKAFGSVSKPQETLAALQPAFDACIDRAPDGPMEVGIAIDDRGAVQRVKVSGDGTEAFEACIAGPIAKARFTTSNLRAGPEQTPQGGVVKFSIARRGE